MLPTKFNKSANVSVNEMSTDISLCDSPSSLDFISLFGDSAIQFFDSGSNHIVFKKLLITPSTQTYCKKYMYIGNEVLIAMAEKQTMAYGVTGPWVQQSGDFACSWSFKLSEKNNYVVGEILMRSVVALFLFIKESFEKYLSTLTEDEKKEEKKKFDITIKYPNDIMIKDDGKWKKVAGIICEKCPVMLKNQNLDVGLECVTGIEYMSPIDYNSKYSASRSNSSSSNIQKRRRSSFKNSELQEEVDDILENKVRSRDLNVSNEDNVIESEKPILKNVKNMTNDNGHDEKHLLIDNHPIGNISSKENNDNREISELFDSSFNNELDDSENGVYDNNNDEDEINEGSQFEYETRIIIGIGLNFIKPELKVSKINGKNNEEQKSINASINEKNKSINNFSGIDNSENNSNEVPDYIKNEKGVLSFYKKWQSTAEGDIDNIRTAVGITHKFIEVMDESIETIIDIYNANWAQRGKLIQENKNVERIVNNISTTYTYNHGSLDNGVLSDKDTKSPAFMSLSDGYSPYIASPSKTETYVIKSITKNNTLIVENVETKETKEWCDVQYIRALLKSCENKLL